MVPLLSLAAFWAFAAYLTAQDAFEKYEALTTYRKVAMPATALAATLQQERVATAVLVSTGGKDRGGVTTARAAADAAQNTFRRSALSGQVRSAMSDTTKRRLDELLTRLDGLPGVRAQVDGDSVAALGAVNAYSAVIE
ncbi:MAG TPA: nitrate- and nitrite sensing domain-containing protein, partial [Actinoallomurus sp.]|nr:nitrate- and nitrite sensing domain-containing protein [Actinoallomurus sp.]